MDCTSTRLSYRQANAFSGIILDYLGQAENLRPFYSYAPDLDGIRQSIAARKEFNGDRDTLVKELKKQYEGVTTSGKVKENIESLSSPTTFTVTTAHQNNIFTGPLYFIYKILHAIKLADSLNDSLPGHHFVPVYYIGSEDADLAELNHIHLDGEKLVWNTKQTGAVGRMKIDQDLLKLISVIEGRLAVEPFGREIVALVKTHYRLGVDIQTAIFQLVNALFAAYGLIVLLPDNTALKRNMTGLFEDDLLHQTASGIVEKTAGELDERGYKVQAHPREINLFYLLNDMRERILKQGDLYRVQGTTIAFTEAELLTELKDHPDRFSPNVILRGIYQETILPNIAFIGGGGEIAYWLQLKELFAHYQVPYPVLILRNSFLIIEKKWQEKIAKLGFTAVDYFLPERELLNRLVARETDKKLRLNGTLSQTEQLYDAIKIQASSIDSTLEKHVEALRSKAVQRLIELEKKMLRAEKRKFSEQERHIRLIKEKLFPGNGLQERHDNILEYYARFGDSLLERLYEHSFTLEQEFVILLEK